MIIQIDAGMEAVISLFEAGWAVGFTQKEATPPSDLNPSMREFWCEGYAAGIADSASASEINHLLH